MKYLGFSHPGSLWRGRRVREAQLYTRSMLPVSAACVVANGIRETLSRLIGSSVALRLAEPSLPSQKGWSAIVRGARIARFHGARMDAALVLRPTDALALAGAAFGEDSNDARDLSQLEATVLGRMVTALGSSVAALVGSDAKPMDGSADLLSFSTYFEVWVDRPVRARIGVALSSEPLPDVAPGIALETLLDLELDVVVRWTGSDLAVGTLPTLEPGAFVPISHARTFGGTAYLAGRPLRGGECGVRGGRYALVIGTSEPVEGSSAPSL